MMSEDVSAEVLRHLRARRALGGEGCWTIGDICRGFDLAEDAVRAALQKLEASGSLRRQKDQELVELPTPQPVLRVRGRTRAS
jgi:DNA-binding transcriptional regulator PaaX